MFQRGFTLLEAIVAIFIVTVGVGGVFTLVNQTSGSARAVSSKLTAIYLAQEGIENVRNIRDGNFIKIRRGFAGVNWDTGISSGDWQPVVFTDGSQSNFQRKITVAPAGADILEVSVEVSWQAGGGPHQVIVQENLYKWPQ